MKPSMWAAYLADLGIFLFFSHGLSRFNFYANILGIFLSGGIGCAANHPFHTVSNRVVIIAFKES
jgi:hypothetical protein